MGKTRKNRNIQSEQTKMIMEKTIKGEKVHEDESEQGQQSRREWEKKQNESNEKQTRCAIWEKQKG